MDQATRPAAQGQGVLPAIQDDLQDGDEADPEEDGHAGSVRGAGGLLRHDGQPGPAHRRGVSQGLREGGREGHGSRRRNGCRDAPDQRRVPAAGFQGRPAVPVPDPPREDGHDPVPGPGSRTEGIDVAQRPQLAQSIILVAVVVVPLAA